MELWSPLLNILILLLGAICERFRQSAVLGYLVAGTLLGPNALNWMHDPDAVHYIAELGVAPHLLIIGFEFSLSRMKRIGAMLALSSTACVLQMLVRYTAMDSVLTRMAKP